MKFLTRGLMVLVFLALVSPAFAAIEVEGDTYINYSSMYLWRGFDLSDGDPVMQGGMDLSFKGLTLSYWSNYNLDDSELDETDLVIDYSFDLSELVSLSVGNILYSINGDDTSEVYAGISLNTILEPAFTIYYDYDQFDGDIYASASIGHSLDIKDGLSLSLGALASYIDADGYDALHNAEFSAALDYAFNEQVSLSPAVIFSTPISDDADDVIDDEMMAGLTLTLSF